MKRQIILTLLFINFLSGTAFAQAKIVKTDKDEYIQQVSQLFKENKWEDGKVIVDQALSKYSEDSDLHELNGRYYIQKKDYDNARYELVKSLSYNKKNISAKQSLVNVEIATERYSSAISYVNELLEYMPYHKDLWLKKIEAYRRQGNIYESNRLLQRLHRIYPNDKDLRGITADFLTEEFYQKRGKASMSELEALALQIIEVHPQDEEVYLSLINSYLQVGNYEKALQYSEQAVHSMPDNMTLVKKRNSILAHLNRYGEILTSTKELMNASNATGSLQQEYDYYLEESLGYSKRSDPYYMLQTLFKKNPRNIEYFNEVFTLALSRNLFDDAIETIKVAKESRGETKDILLKELYLYERMGNISKSRQLTYHISDLYPEDEDVQYQKCILYYGEAKGYISDRLFHKAIPYLNYIEEHGDSDFVRLSLVAKYNCFIELVDNAEADTVINKLITLEPDEPTWRFKKSLLLGTEKKYLMALTEYEAGLNIANTQTGSAKGFNNGYEEQAAIYVKSLIEGYSFDQAIDLIDHWLGVFPESEIALRYGYNVASQMNNTEKAKAYLVSGVESHPEELFFQLKLVDIYNTEKDFNSASRLLESLLAKYPYHKEVIAINSQVSLNRAKVLFKESKPNEGLEILNQAAIYDPTDNDIAYMKGVAYEKLHLPDSAFYYQSLYLPSLSDFQEHKRHLSYLKYLTKQNEVSFYCQVYRFGDIDIMTSIAGAEYTRMEKDNTYTGRLLYSGRDEGKSIMAQGEWTRKFTSDLSGMLNFSLGSKTFPKFMISPTVYYTFRPTWEAEATVGLRQLADSGSMFNVQLGVSKDFDFARFTTKVNFVHVNQKLHYNISGQSRFFISNPQNYIFVVGGFGSSPEMEIIDNQLYNSFSVTNSMVSLGGHFLLNQTISIEGLGALYNYKVGEDSYKNVYSMQLKLGIRF